MKLPCVVLILIYSGFIESTSENFKVVGPAVPFVAEAGEDLVLPCSLQPNISAVDMMVEWIRTDWTDTDNLVHPYEAHKDRNEKQIKSYRGRTALFKEELQKGNTSLKLSAVQLSDEGAYKCLVKSTFWYDDITVHVVQVKVHSKVVGPDAPLVVEAGEDLILPCSLQPNINAEDMMVEWIRPDRIEIDKLVHLYEDHGDRNNDQMVSYRGRTALYKQELWKGNTSLKLSAVQPSDEGAFKCLIRYRSWYDDVTLYVEVKDQVFQAWKIVTICFSVFAVILMAFTAYILKDKLSKKELSPAQCSAVAYMQLKSQYVHEKLDLNRYNTSEEGYRRLIPAMTNYRKAHFAGCKLTVTSIKTLSATLQTENSSLKELDLSNNAVQDSGIELLSAGLRNSHCKLEILRLASCNLGEKSCEELGSVLKLETSSLKEMDISNNYLGDLGIAHLSAGLKSSHCKLETLKLALCHFGEKSCENLRSVFQTETSSLKELDISNNKLLDSGVELLSAGLKSSYCKLEILRLSLCSFGENVCENLGSVLQTETSSLKELDISTNELCDSGLHLLSAGLKSSYCKLEILRLASCNFGQKSCENLQSILQSETSLLKELDISNNELHNSGVALISVGLKSSYCKLEILRLSGCMVKEKGCYSLALALSSNPSHLKELDLTYNHLGESGVELLSARLEDPQCALNTLRVEHEGKMRIRPKKYSCEFTLDPNTAHQLLSLSDGNRAVENVGSSQSYPDHPERFDYYKQVLCRESVTGCCYWEAEWSGREAEVALTYKSINRKGDDDDCDFGWNEKSWVLRCSDNSYSVRHNKIITELSTPPSDCKRVGVYVDCPADTLSFYRVSSDQHTLTHLYTFYTSFTESLHTETLHAGFWVDYYSSVCLCDIK